MRKRKIIHFSAVSNKRYPFEFLINSVFRDVFLKAIYSFSSRSLDVHIVNIREKLKKNPNVKIITVHGKGYILKDGFVNLKPIEMSL